MAVSPPTNVSISNNSTTNQLAYSFDAAPDDSISIANDKYDMRYATNSAMTAASLQSAYINAGGSATYSGTITGLSAGTTYYVQFRYMNSAGGFSVWADLDPRGNAEDSATTDVAVPDAPGTPSVTGKTDTTLGFSWSAVSGATGYKLYYGTSNNPTGPGITQSGTTKAFGSLTAATTYYFRIKAYNSSGDSGYSGVQTTDTATVDPSIPVASSNVDPTEQVITWPTPTGTYYSYLYGTGNNSTNQLQAIAVGSTETHTQATTPGSTYYYRTRTITLYHDSFYSDYGAQLTATAASVAVPIYASFGYTATSTSTITFNWTNPTYSDRTYLYTPSTLYQVTNPDYVTGTTRLIDGGGSGDEVQGNPVYLTQNSSFSLVARNYYDGHYSSYTSTFTGYTLPGPPTSVSATATSYDAIALGWTNPAGSALSETFTIQRKEGSGGTYADVLGGTGVTGTTYTDSDTLSQSTTYYYQIKTVTTAGVSAYSSGVNATTAAGPNPVAGDGLELGKLGVETGDIGSEGSEISMGTASGGTSEVKMSDFFLGSLVAVTGNNNLYPSQASVYEVTRQNIGSEWTEQIKSVAANFTWSINNSNGTVSTNSGYRATIQAIASPGATFTISCVYAGPFNDHMTTGEKTATPKTVTIAV